MPMQLRTWRHSLFATCAVTLLTVLPCVSMPAHAEPAATASSATTSSATTSSASATPAAAVHPDVQRALSYQVPQPSCTPPEIRRSNQNAGQLERNERATKRYTKCLEVYQQSLFNDFTFMRGVVRHGVNMQQAEVIATNMTRIADAIKGLKGRGVALAQDQARIISTGLSGNRQLPGAQ